MPEWKSGQIILGEYAIEKRTRPRWHGPRVAGQEPVHRAALCGHAVIDSGREAPHGFLDRVADLDRPARASEHRSCRFFCTVGDGIVIFADYIEGGSVAAWIAKGKLTGLEQILDHTRKGTHDE
jgi:hypothetical protein